MIARVFAIGSLVFLAGCDFNVCFDPSEAKPSVGTAKNAIVGGTVDDANRSTVAVLLTTPSGSHGICTGTMIAKSGDVGYVLTAAHCATGTVDSVVEATDWRDCEPGGDASMCRASYTVSSWQSHPDYDPAHEKNDFAMVIVAGVGDATEVTPAVDGPDDLITSESIEISGFGRTYQGANDPSAFQSVRHHVTVPIDALDSDEIGIDATTGHTACFGDSGGPAYAQVGGQRRVVGVTWAGDQNCAQVAIYGRVSSVYEDFIAPIIAPALDQGCGECVQSSLSTSPGCDAPLAVCTGAPGCAALLACVDACDGTLDACFFACSPPDIETVVAFNELANCAACASCSGECGVDSCAAPPGTSSSSGTGGSTPGSTSSSSGVTSSGAGPTGPSAVASTGAGSSIVDPGGAGPGDGGAGGGEPSGTTALPSKVCAPVHLSCSSSPADDGGSSSSIPPFVLALAALGLMAAGRRHAR